MPTTKTKTSTTRAKKSATKAKKSTAKAKKSSKRVAVRSAAGRRPPGGARPAFDPAAYVCNIVPSTDTERDWTFESSLAAGALTAAAALPASVDLRASWWKIGNQESTGSCVGWATADGLGRFYLTKAGRLPQSNSLSPRYIWMASKETDEDDTRPESFIEEAGTSLKAASDIARKYGFALETDLPFHIPTVMYSGKVDAFYAGCAQRRIASYFNLRRSLQQWKAWLASSGPILAALQVDQNWDNAATTNGVIQNFDPATVRGGHAIAVVGYRADGTFIVRNSWSTAWGDKGFGYVTPGYIAAAFFDEAYGFTV